MKKKNCTPNPSLGLELKLGLGLGMVSGVLAVSGNHMPVLPAVIVLLGALRLAFIAGSAAMSEC